MKSLLDPSFKYVHSNTHSDPAAFRRRMDARRRAVAGQQKLAADAVVTPIKSRTRTK